MVWALDVIIDNEGVVHAYWGLCRALGSVSTTTGDTGFSGFLTSASLVHWKEGDTETQLIGGAVDRNDNGQLDFNSDILTNLQNLAYSKERHLHFSSLAVFLSLAKLPFYLYMEMAHKNGKD